MPFRGRSSQTRCKHCIGALTRRRGCESEALADVLEQMRGRKIGSGMRTGQAELQLLLYQFPLPLLMYKEKLQYSNLLCGQIYN